MGRWCSCQTWFEMSKPSLRSFPGSAFPGLQVVKNLLCEVLLLLLLLVVVVYSRMMPPVWDRWKDPMHFTVGEGWKLLAEQDCLTWGGTRGTLWQSNMTCWNIPYLVRRFFPFKALFTGDFPKTFTQTSISFSDFPAVLEDFIGPGIGTWSACHKLSGPEIPASWVYKHQWKWWSASD